MVQIDQADRIVGQIYDTALQPSTLPDLAASIAAFCGVANSAFVIVDNAISYSTVITPGADPQVVADYQAFWWQHDPTIAGTASLPVGMLTSLDYTGRELFHASAFHNEFWIRSGLSSERLAANLATGGRLFSSIVLQPPAGHNEISHETRGAAGLLIPHLVRTVSIMQRLMRLETETFRAGAQGTEEGPVAGTLLVDASCRLLFADEQAERLLGQGCPLSIRSGEIAICGGKGNDTFRRAVAECASRRISQASLATILAHGPSRPGAFDIEVLPFRDSDGHAGTDRAIAIVVIRHARSNRAMQVQILRDAYGLTVAEANIALETLAGDGRQAVATRCGISVNTARTHLSRVFDKVGVNRQAELIRTLSACLGRQR